MVHTENMGGSGEDGKPPEKPNRRGGRPSPRPGTPRPPRKRRRRPHPGMRNSGASTSPRRSASMISSTSPATNGCTRMPFPWSRASTGRETAPHTRTRAPSCTNRCTRSAAEAPARSISVRFRMRPPAISSTSRRRPTSNTGAMRPFHTEIAAFVRVAGVFIRTCTGAAVMNGVRVGLECAAGCCGVRTFRRCYPSPLRAGLQGTCTGRANLVRRAAAFAS